MASRKNHRLHCVHVPAGKTVDVPDGFTIHHSTLIEPKKGNPYFAVLLTNEQSSNTSQLPSAFGFRVSE